MNAHVVWLLFNHFHPAFIGLYCWPLLPLSREPLLPSLLLKPSSSLVLVLLWERVLRVEEVRESSWIPRMALCKSRPVPWLPPDGLTNVHGERDCYETQGKWSSQNDNKCWKLFYIHVHVPFGLLYDTGQNHSSFSCILFPITLTEFPRWGWRLLPPLANQLTKILVLTRGQLTVRDRNKPHTHLSNKNGHMRIYT